MNEASIINNYDIEGKIEQFVMQVPTVSPGAEGHEIKDLFENNPETEGIVVLENRQPVGLIMRTAFYQQIGSLHGHALYMKRPITLVMDSAMMIVEVEDNLSQIGIQAMNREQSKLYDFVLVRRGGEFLGVVSIRHFLVDLANRNAAQIHVLKFQQKELLLAHQKVTALNKDIESKSNAVRNLLDNADQGFLFFGSDLFVKNEFSFKCVEIFQAQIGGQHFISMITPYFPEDKLPVFTAAFESYFRNNSPITDNVYLMLLPADCRVGSKHIHVEYRRITHDGSKAVMAIFNDITDKVNMEKAMERDRYWQRLLIKAFGCQAQIKRTIDEFNELFSGGYSVYLADSGDTREALQELFRAVHTYKGDFAQYGFAKASENLHQFEDRLAALLHSPDPQKDAIREVMAALDPDEVLREDMTAVTDSLGEGYFRNDEIVSIPMQKLREAERKITGLGDSLELNGVLEVLHGLRLQSFRAQLLQYEDYMQYLSGRLLKSMPVFMVEGADIEIDKDHNREFCKALVHIFRNIMDHGIEPDEERIKLGKPQRGLVVCRISREGSSMLLQISDDGRGLDLDKIKQKARALFPAEQPDEMSEAQIADLIFRDSISTKDVASSLSGRGVGLAAFRDTCVKLGGNVKVTTKQGEGTLFSISLPI